VFATSSNNALSFRTVFSNATRRHVAPNPLHASLHETLSPVRSTNTFHVGSGISSTTIVKTSAGTAGGGELGGGGNAGGAGGEGANLHGQNLSTFTPPNVVHAN